MNENPRDRTDGAPRNLSRISSARTTKISRILQAKQLLLRQAQARCFGEDGLQNPRLKYLNPYFDENGLMHSGGRLENLEAPRMITQSILLSDDPFTRLIINQKL